MRLSSRLLFVSLLCCCIIAANPALTHAQAAKPAAPAIGSMASPSATYDKLLSQMEEEFVGAAEAMPEDKYNFAPPVAYGEFKGVRTFAAQVKHVAESEYYFFGGPSYTDAEDKTRTDAIEKLTGKAEIVASLKSTFADAHKFIATITPENAFQVTPHGTRAGMATFGISHMMDHYGQMVEYLRMNGIVPPASRGGM